MVVPKTRPKNFRKKNNKVSQKSFMNELKYCIKIFWPGFRHFRTGPGFRHSPKIHNDTILYEMPHYEASNQLLHYDLVIKTEIKIYYEMSYYAIRNEILLNTMP